MSRSACLKNLNVNSRLAGYNLVIAAALGCVSLVYPLSASAQSPGCGENEVCGYPKSCYCDPPTEGCICDGGVCTPDIVSWLDNYSYETTGHDSYDCLRQTPNLCGRSYECIPIASASSCANNAGCHRKNLPPTPLYTTKYTALGDQCTPG